MRRYIFLDERYQYNMLCSEAQVLFTNLQLKPRYFRHSLPLSAEKGPVLLQTV